MSAEGNVQIIVHGSRETALSSGDASASDGLGLNCYHVDWKPEPTLMESQELVVFCEAFAPSTDMSLEKTAHQLEVVSGEFVLSALQIVLRESKNIAPCFLNFVEWMQRESSSCKVDTLLKKVLSGRKF